ACSSTVGPIIPPSVPMIIYALVAENVSVGAMFAAGVIPGVMIGAGLMGLVYILARKRGYAADYTTYIIVEKVKITQRFLVGAFLPIIMVGGIIFGIFTPVEAGAVAVLYAVLVGFFVTKSLSLSMVYGALLRTGVISSVVFLMMGIANVQVGYLLPNRFPKLSQASLHQLQQLPCCFYY